MITCRGHLWVQVTNNLQINLSLSGLVRAVWAISEDMSWAGGSGPTLAINKDILTLTANTRHGGERWGEQNNTIQSSQNFNVLYNWGKISGIDSCFVNHSGWIDFVFVMKMLINILLLPIRSRKRHRNEVWWFSTDRMLMGVLKSSMKRSDAFQI